MSDGAGFFDDFTGTWMDDLELANSTPVDIPAGAIEESGGFDWNPFDGLGAVADRALATYKTLSDIDVSRREIELRGQAQTGALNLQQQRLTSESQLAQQRMATEGTIAKMGNAAQVAVSQARAAIPQALASIVTPRNILLIGAALGLAWFLKRRA